MKKRLFMLLGTFLFAVAVPVLSSARQTGSEPEYHFVVWLHDGGKVTFPLDAHPVVTHRDGMLVVSAAESSVEYAHSSVRKFTIEAVEEVPEEPEPDPTPEPNPTPEAELYVVVWLHSGARIGFPFAEHPRLTYSDGDIVVTTNYEQLSYPHASVRKFTLTDEDISQGETTDIAPGEREAQWQRHGDVMMFSACTPGERVIIYNATGQQIAQYAISADGTLQIPLSQFVEGMYVVKTESITYKFMKR